MIAEQLKLFFVDLNNAQTCIVKSCCISYL